MQVVVTSTEPDMSFITGSGQTSNQNLRYNQMDYVKRPLNVFKINKVTYLHMSISLNLRTGKMS